MTLSDVDIFLF